MQAQTIEVFVNVPILYDGWMERDKPRDRVFPSFSALRAAVTCMRRGGHGTVMR
jgi:hypothetical protein